MMRMMKHSFRRSAGVEQRLADSNHPLTAIYYRRMLNNEPNV